MSQVFENDFDKDIAVLVMSCDKYADLWKPYFDSFFHHWGQSSWPIYLAANELKFEDSRVISLLSGQDKDWTSSIRAVLQQVVQNDHLS